MDNPQCANKRSLSGRLEQNIKRARKIDDNRSNKRVWTFQDIQSVLDFMKNTIKEGNSVESPNAMAYYRRAAAELKLCGCDGLSVKNNVSSLKKGYEAAIQWREQSGQGIDDENSVREILLQHSPHFDDLDEIFASRASIHVPYRTESNGIGPGDDDDVPFVSINNESIIYGDSQQSVSPSTPVIDSTEIRSCKPSSTKKISATKSEYTELVNRRHDVLMAQHSIEKEKLILENKKIDIQKESQNIKMVITEQKFEFKKSTFFHELEFRKEKLNFEKEKFHKEKNIELEKFKMEQEYKLKLKLAKLGK